MDKPRKEKVLHTRVPEVLEQELKRLAKSLRVPVSNVVRTILEDAVDTVDAVGEMAEDELHSIAKRLARRRQKMTGERIEPAEQVSPDPAPSAEPTLESADRPSPLPPLSGVVGYQQLLLARTEKCTLCGASLEAGERAYLGVREVPGPRVLIDEVCLPFSAAGAATEEE